MLLCQGSTTLRPAPVTSKKSPRVIGNVWPDSSDNWTCENIDNQIENTEAMSQFLADAGAICAPILGTGVCFPADHAGLVFPEMTLTQFVPKGWYPTFPDYLALGALVIARAINVL